MISKILGPGGNPLIVWFRDAWCCSCKALIWCPSTTTSKCSCWRPYTASSCKSALPSCPNVVCRQAAVSAHRCMQDGRDLFAGMTSHQWGRSMSRTGKSCQQQGHLRKLAGMAHQPSFRSKIFRSIAQVCGDTCNACR